MIELVVWLAGSCLSTFGFMYIFYKLNSVEKLFTLKTIIIYIIGVLFVTLVQHYEIEYIGHISFFIFYPILFYNMKPLPFKKLIYYLIFIWLCGVAVDFLIMAVIAVLNTFLEFDVYGYIFECLLSLIVVFVYVILGHSKKLKKFAEGLYVKLINIKYASFALIFFAIFTFFIGVVIFSSLNNLSISLLLTLLVALVLIIFAFLIKARINEIENAKFLKTLKENNDFYIKVDDENRIFKHNLNAKLMSIKSVSNDKAKSLIVDLMNQYNCNTDISDSIKIIPYGLNGIIYEKVYPYLNSLNIKIDNSIDYDIFDVLRPRRYNVFVEKMVIAIDNAIEAALKSQNKILIINLFENENSLIIEIGNSFHDLINLDDFGKKNYSTKGKKRGLGIFSALRNSEASLSIKIVNNLFVSKIKVKKRLDN